MKKNLVSALIVIVVAIAICWFLKKTNQNARIIPQTNEVSPISNSNVANSLPTTSFPSPTIITNELEPVNETTNEPINAIAVTNIEQWKVAIKDLRSLGYKHSQEWLVETPGRKTSIPIVLNINNKTVQYNAVLISVSADNEYGSVRRVEIQTLDMNIDETRELGLQLCNMLQVDPKNFLEWCNKVGNHWLDAPLYANGSGSFGFGTHRTYDDEKPWFFNFVIDYQH